MKVSGLARIAGAAPSVLPTSASERLPVAARCPSAAPARRARETRHCAGSRDIPCQGCRVRRPASNFAPFLSWRLLRSSLSVLPFLMTSGSAGAPVRRCRASAAAGASSARGATTCTSIVSASLTARPLRASGNVADANALAHQQLGDIHLDVLRDVAPATPRSRTRASRSRGCRPAASRPALRPSPSPAR